VRAIAAEKIMSCAESAEKSDDRMRWVVLELVCRRQEGGRDEVLVHWACSWLTRADFDSGRFGKVAEVVETRFVGAEEQLLVQWACSWELAVDVDQELLDELGDAPGEAVVDSGAGDEVVGGGTAAVAMAPAKKRKRAVKRGW
jgi:hypothetical protein